MEINRFFTAMFLLFALSSTARGEFVEVRNKETELYVRSAFEEIASSWTLLQEAGNGTQMYFFSPPQRVSENRLYCFRVGFSFRRKENGSFPEVVAQFQMGDILYRYALNQRGDDCRAVDEREYFSASAFDDQRPNIGLLDATKTISDFLRVMKKENLRAEILYHDDVAKICLLEHGEDILIDEVDLSLTKDNSEFYRVSALCNLKGKRWPLIIALTRDVDKEIDRYSVMRNEVGS